MVVEVLLDSTSWEKGHPLAPSFYKSQQRRHPMALPRKNRLIRMRQGIHLDRFASYYYPDLLALHVQRRGEKILRLCDTRSLHRPASSLCIKGKAFRKQNELQIPARQHRRAPHRNAPMDPAIAYQGVRSASPACEALPSGTSFDCWCRATEKP